MVNHKWFLVIHVVVAAAWFFEQKKCVAFWFVFVFNGRLSDFIFSLWKTTGSGYSKHKLKHKFMFDHVVPITRIKIKPTTPKRTKKKTLWTNMRSRRQYAFKIVIDANLKTSELRSHQRIRQNSVLIGQWCSNRQKMQLAVECVCVCVSMCDVGHQRTELHWRVWKRVVHEQMRVGSVHTWDVLHILSKYIVQSIHDNS